MLKNISQVVGLAGLIFKLFCETSYLKEVFASRDASGTAQGSSAVVGEPLWKDPAYVSLRGSRDLQLLLIAGKKDGPVSFLCF